MTAAATANETWTTSAGVLLEELRQQGVRLQADGLTLRVDAPADAATNELFTTLQENKRNLIRLLERERRKLEEADRRGLIIKWSREPDYIALHDPTTGEWHEVRAFECLPSIVESVKSQHRRGKAGA